MSANNALKNSSERSSSSASIYNYPDHLNPFYDEDNHKRLRFWKSSQANENSKKRSFSIGNLRDIWTFRSFNMKKKSSTLGIQKTSESPPILRRNLEQSSENRRPMMSSLQNVNAPLGTQSSRASSSPYYQGCSKFDRRSTPQHLMIRSSYSSLSSTNPFESDIESDVISIGSIGAGVRPKSYRKKRKAPLAPIHNMVEKPSLDDVEGKGMDISQASYKEAKPDIDIMSLTSEIERFVNQENETSTTKVLSFETRADSKTPPTINIIEVPSDPVQDTSMETCHSKNMATKENMDIKALGNEIEGFVNQKNKTSTTKLVSLESRTDSDTQSTIKVSQLPSDPIQNKSMEICHCVHIETNQDIDIKTKDKQRVVSNRSANSNNLMDTCHSVQVETKQDVGIKKKEKERFLNNRSENLNNKMLMLGSATETDTLGVDAMDTSLLRTSESINHISNQINSFVTKTERSKKMSTPNIEHLEASKQVHRNLQDDKVITNIISMETAANSNQNNSLEYERVYENNYIPKNFECLNKPLAIFEKTEKKSNSQEKTVKAKSVKDIIDSINRSQLLLKESAAKGTTVYSTSLYLKNNTMPIVQQNRHCEVAQSFVSNGGSENQSPLPQIDFRKDKINKTVFQCRESSPTASNLDWNPVPKPKRINSDLINKD